MDDNAEINTKNNFRDIAIILSIFMILYVNNSYNIAIIEGTITLGVSLVSSILLLVVRLKSRINLKVLLIILILCINVLITGILTGDSIKDSIIMISVVVISFIFITTVSIDEYFNKYNKLIYVLSVYSLGIYALAVFFPNIIRVFPSAYYRPTQEVYNLGLAFVNLRGSLIRNMGIFWEPGVFQTYLVFALLGEIFILKDSNKIRIWVFLITIITTWSTTGLINAVILLVIYVIYKNIHKRNKYIKIFMALAVLISFLATIYTFLPHEIQHAFFGKIISFINSDRSDVTSAYVRFTSFTYPLKAFLSSPITGVGYKGLVNSVLPAGHGMVTNTLVNWFTAYGILFGTIALSGIYGLSRRMVDKSKLLRLLIIFVLLLSVISQQYLRNTSIFIFILYGTKYILQRRPRE